MNVNLKSLIAKLNEETRNALEAAAGLCVSRNLYDVEVEHFLVKLLDSREGTWRDSVPLRVDKSRLAAELTRTLDG